MNDDIPTTLDQFVAEALSLRTCAPDMPGTQAAPHEVHQHLLDIRSRLDRVEHLLATAVRTRARAQRVADRLTAEAGDEWDQAITRIRAAPVRLGDEYSSARERAAGANLATFEAQRAARAAANLVSSCAEAVDVLRLTHRGLDGLRSDTIAVLRLLQFESHLER